MRGGGGGGGNGGSSFSINKAPDWLDGIFCALLLPLLWLRWWARGKQPGSRGPRVHLQVGCSLVSSSHWRNRSPAAGTRPPAARCALPGGPGAARRAARISDCSPAAGAPGGGGRFRPASARWYRASRKSGGSGESSCLAAEGFWGHPGSGHGASRCGPQPLGPGRGQAWVIFASLAPIRQPGLLSRDLGTVLEDLSEF